MKTVTIKDIAKRAGIAYTTVAKIINNKDIQVRPSTRERVLNLVQEMNYRPNHFATTLKTGKTYCIGLMGSQTSVKFTDHSFSKIADSIESAINRNKSDYSLLVFGAHYDNTAEKSIDLIQKGMVDGLLFVVLSLHLPKFEREMLPMLKNYNISTVVIHSLTKSLNYNNVGMDCTYGGYIAAEHLIKLGYQEIGFYNFAQQKSLMIDEMLQGFKKALSDHNISWDNKRVLTVSDSIPRNNPYKDTYETMKRIEELPRALFISNDGAAYGALKAFKERGIRVPEDVAIVGFNNETLGSYVESELTTVHHPLREKGEVAVRMLLDILEGRLKKGEVHQKILTPHLVVRETCGAKK